MRIEEMNPSRAFLIWVFIQLLREKFLLPLIGCVSAKLSYRVRRIQADTSVRCHDNGLHRSKAVLKVGANLLHLLVLQFSFCAYEAASQRRLE